MQSTPTIPHNYTRNQHSGRFGVLIAPFQIPHIDGPHLDILCRIAFEYHPNPPIVVLPVKRIPTSKDSPLNLEERSEMIWGFCPEARIVAWNDTKYSDDLFGQLWEGLYQLTNGSHDLFGDQALIDQLLTKTRRNGVLPPNLAASYSLLKYEAGAREMVRFPEPYRLVSDREAFRRGIISANNRGYATSFQAVDVAITRYADYDPGAVLLGRKPGEFLWRFLGGFVDPEDVSLEAAALREAKEECGTTDLTSPRYIGSAKVNDWRYAGERDSIKTALFETNYYGAAELKAGDDIKNLEWFEESNLSPSIIESEHHELLRMFLGRSK